MEYQPAKSNLKKLNYYLGLYLRAYVDITSI